MSDAQRLKELSNERKKYNDLKKTAEKRKKAVDKALAKAEEISKKGAMDKINSGIEALKKGLSPLSATFDANLPANRNEADKLENETYRLGREVSKYKAKIDDLDYQIRILQIEEG